MTVYDLHTMQFTFEINCVHFHVTNNCENLERGCALYIVECMQEHCKYVEKSNPTSNVCMHAQSTGLPLDCNDANVIGQSNAHKIRRQFD